MVVIEWGSRDLPTSEQDIQITSNSGSVPSLIGLQSSRFNRLTVLNISRLGLETIAGITEDSFPLLKLLFCSFNHISDIDPLLGHSTLEFLDLEGNQISDKSNLFVISTLPSLKQINLKDNPLDCTPQIERPLSTASTAETSSARENEEISIILDQVRRPSTARSLTFTGNPVSWARSQPSSPQVHQPPEKRQGNRPVKIFPAIKKSSN
jgi:Leucine-rich repeat (LRR) protein